MDGVGYEAANGVAHGHFFDSGKFVHTMQLNIAPAPDGYFYEGWLTSTDGEIISTGHLRNHLGDARHQHRFEVDADVRSHTTVIVTLEPDDGDPAPGKHVAEGVLTVRER